MAVNNRIVVALDLDCFYAQVVTTLDKSLRGRTSISFMLSDCIAPIDRETSRNSTKVYHCVST